MTDRNLPPLTLSREVTDALAAGEPVVALESTIITHGMPWPDNVGTAARVEAAVRGEGAVPATIAVMGGEIRVGLSADELEDLAGTKNVMKLSRADLPFALAKGATGSTTVAATMICAHLAGIRVFATGGIGGVHRGAEESFDISADLQELAQTPVAVVCAGAKALLDIPKTLEVLETKGVPVIGYGTDRFPAFWSRESSLPAPLRADTPEEIAALFAMKQRLGLAGGLLIANPVPEADEIAAQEMETHLAAALANAAREGITGKSVTPFILDRIYRLTEGRSLKTNIALVLNNAKLAAELARVLAAK
jgi:pseudouridine-5'-phosphate glycosidase